MASGRPMIHIDRIDKIECDVPIHPMAYELLHDYLRSRHGQMPHELIEGPLRPPAREEERGWLHALDVIGKVVSAISGIAVVLFVILVWSGQASVGGLSIGTLLTIASFTLVGGFVSIGGVKIFSLSASLRRARERVERVIGTAGGCPFVRVVDDQTRQRYQIQSPYQVGSTDFCSGCHLVDQGGRTNCTISPHYRH